MAQAGPNGTTPKRSRLAAQPAASPNPRTTNGCWPSPARPIPKNAVILAVNINIKGEAQRSNSDATLAVDSLMQLIEEHHRIIKGLYVFGYDGALSAEDRDRLLKAGIQPVSKLRRISETTHFIHNFGPHRFVHPNETVAHTTDAIAIDGNAAVVMTDGDGHDCYVPLTCRGALARCLAPGTVRWVPAVWVIVLSLLPAGAVIWLLIRAVYGRGTIESRANRLLHHRLNQASDGKIGAAEALAAINGYELVLEEQVHNAAISAELAEELRLGIARLRAGLERQARDEQIAAGIDGVAMEMLSALCQEAALALAASHPMTIELLMPVPDHDDQRKRVLRGLVEADAQRFTYLFRGIHDLRDGLSHPDAAEQALREIVDTCISLQREIETGVRANVTHQPWVKRWETWLDNCESLDLASYR